LQNRHTYQLATDAQHRCRRRGIRETAIQFLEKWCSKHKGGARNSYLLGYGNELNVMAKEEVAAEAKRIGQALRTNLLARWAPAGSRRCGSCDFRDTAKKIAEDYIKQRGMRMKARGKVGEEHQAGAVDGRKIGVQIEKAD
jgi:hypothetical protein